MRTTSVLLDQQGEIFELDLSYIILEMKRKILLYLIQAHTSACNYNDLVAKFI